MSSTTLTSDCPATTKVHPEDTKRRLFDSELMAIRTLLSGLLTRTHALNGHARVERPGGSRIIQLELYARNGTLKPRQRQLIKAFASRLRKRRSLVEERDPNNTEKNLFVFSIVPAPTPA